MSEPNKSIELQNLTLNKVLVALAVLTLCGGLITGGVAWAKGWLGMPDRVSKLQADQELLMALPPRVDQLEKAQAQMWQKRSEDHDLLLRMSQSLDDIKAQSAETRLDVKDLHNRAVLTTK